jgi:group I intron endonuclease
MGYIYRITNKITKQNYIGQTIQDLNERWKQHKSAKSNCRYLKSAFKKYGLENFDFKLICIGFDSDLNNLEIYYINKYNSIVPNGYNLRLGGNSGGKHNEETKIKISETLKKTLKNPNIVRIKNQLGKPHTEEIKNKISNSLKGRKLKPESIQKRIQSVIMYKIFKIDIQTGAIIQEFNGYSEAAKSIGVKKGSIWKACNGIIKSCRDFIWKSQLKN